MIYFFWEYKTLYNHDNDVDELNMDNKNQRNYYKNIDEQDDSKGKLLSFHVHIKA
jgi:hypothetical protein